MNEQRKEPVAMKTSRMIMNGLTDPHKIMSLWMTGVVVIMLGLSGADAIAKPNQYPYNITTTTGMVNDIVKQVVGDLAKTRNIIGEGIDPHLYRPTRGDVAALLSADVVFYSGLMLEGKMADTLKKISKRGKLVYAVTEHLNAENLLESPIITGHHDPHVWMDVNSWSFAAQAVADTLCDFDPLSATTYQSNVKRYRKQLESLDSYVRDIIGSIPLKNRVMITAHDAFSYFGRAYHIEVLGIQGISTESEAGIQDINHLVDVIVERNIRAVFVETSVSDKNIRALIEGAQSRGRKITIGGSLYSDAMGQPGTYEGTYIGMIDRNATTIARALGGIAPAKGMLGKLSTK